MNGSKKTRQKQQSRSPSSRPPTESHSNSSPSQSYYYASHPPPSYPMPPPQSAAGHNGGPIMFQPHHAPHHEYRVQPQYTSSGALAFPWVLHQLLDNAGVQGFDHIVSWWNLNNNNCNPNNSSTPDMQHSRNAFRVHHIQDFCKTVLPKYFKNQTKYKSFQRQLNLYGFHRISNGPWKGVYWNENFVQGRPDLCRFMIRNTAKVNKKRSPTIPGMPATEQESPYTRAQQSPYQESPHSAGGGVGGARMVGAPDPSTSNAQRVAFPSPTKQGPFPQQQAFVYSHLHNNSYAARHSPHSSSDSPRHHFFQPPTDGPPNLHQQYPQAPTRPTHFFAPPLPDSNLRPRTEFVCHCQRQDAFESSTRGEHQEDRSSSQSAISAKSRNGSVSNPHQQESATSSGEQRNSRQSGRRSRRSVISTSPMMVSDQRGLEGQEHYSSLLATNNTAADNNIDSLLVDRYPSSRSSSGGHETGAQPSPRGSLQGDPLLQGKFHSPSTRRGEGITVSADAAAPMSSWLTNSNTPPPASSPLAPLNMLDSSSKLEGSSTTLEADLANAFLYTLSPSFSAEDRISSWSNNSEHPTRRS